MRRLAPFGLACLFAGVVASPAPAAVGSDVPSAFAPSVELPAGPAASAVVVADVDKDAARDIVVANADSDDVSVLFGNGDGTFGSPSNFPVAAGPSAVRVADMNRDGLPDIVVAHDIAGVLLVLVQGPPRTFTQSVEVETGEGPTGLDVADLNRDGMLDAVTANAFELVGTLSVRFGRGDGTFFAGACADGMPCDTDSDCGEGSCLALELETVPEDSELFTGPWAVRAIDVTGDRRVDLVAANTDGANVAVLPGNGDGTFGEPRNFLVGEGPIALEVVDLDIDGHPDIVTVDEDDFTLSILQGTGGGEFAGVGAVPVGEFPAAVSAWDFNLDGRPDLAVTGTVGDADAVSVLRGRADGTFETREDFEIGGSGPVSVASGDLDGDRRRDLVTANRDSEDPEDAVSVLFNEAVLAVGDANVDGRVDEADLDRILSEIFDGDGDGVIQVAGGALQSGPGVDTSGDEKISAADLVAMALFVAEGQG
ncbi:MAG: hypothetical protein KatS3mg076_1636 [Candidatus Binatia bacterium]|nr:MAG: hypothetical protein KatS3mg076_1636 [Candidatus Binatia bacterium]